MCGVAGFLKQGALSAMEMQRDLPRMADALAHRGPDDQGLWFDAAAGIALCHRRLAIIDLSALGHQPMRSPGERYVITYNGEIYNYRELRDELRARGCIFRSESDTEVLLAAMDCWGVAGAVERASGMFAFAVWDRQERTLHLARDRFGEKPLYFGVLGDTLMFGSELKALREHRAWRGDIDRRAVALLMQHDFIPAPFSIFSDVRKVRAGSIVSASAQSGSIRFQEQRYWRPEELIDRAAGDACAPGPEESLELVDAALTRAIDRQMLADVPLGAFLSGGTDSSLVVAYMQKAATQRVRTFSIGFTESQYDESPFARGVAQHLQTDHTEMIVTPRDCLEVIPDLPRIYDEPFADSSQIPTFLVSRMTRRSVTVALSGDGGDELFAGYGRYAVAMAKWRTLRKWPAVLRSGGSALLDTLPLNTLELAARPAALLLQRDGAALADRLHDRSSRWRSQSLREFYQAGLRRWNHRSQPVLGIDSNVARDNIARPEHADDLKQMMHFDACEYLPDDILVKVDRAAMAVSLETRVPLLDVDVALAAWRIPSNVLMHDGRGKWVLRKLLQRHVPAHLIDRPKKGFAVPVAQWLRGELRPWASELLDPSRLRAEGYLDCALVQRRWRQHQNGQANWAPHLWSILSFQAWLEYWRQDRRSAPKLAEAG